MTDTRIDEIRARADVATPGHWGTHYDGKGTYTIEAQPRFVPGSGAASVNEGIVAILTGEHGDPQTYADARFAAHAREDVPYLLDWVAELEAALGASGTADSQSDIHTHFNLSYVNYLVLPRTLLQSMPAEWQARFVKLLSEYDAAFEHVPQAEAYDVTPGEWGLLGDMTKEQLEAAGIKETRGHFDANDEPTEGLLFHREKDGAELTDQDYGFVPAADPVPNYNRGRTRVEPRLGGSK